MSDNLKELRRPFEPHQISKLPKPTKQQTEAVRADFRAGSRCGECGGWHHPDVIHLDYVGHAALTDRLLDVDPAWFWEPLAINDAGLPALDLLGGLWIKLTVCGVTRLGYGNADGKTGGDAVKEMIGDALRNAAMRFGCALDLWHKGDLHVNTGKSPKPHPNSKEAQAAKRAAADAHPVFQVLAGYMANESEWPFVKEAMEEMSRAEQIEIFNLCNTQQKQIIRDLQIKGGAE